MAGTPVPRAPGGPSSHSILWIYTPPSGPLTWYLKTALLYWFSISPEVLSCSQGPPRREHTCFPFISRHGGDTPPGWGRRKTNGYKTCKDQLQWRWHQQGIKAPNVSTCRCLRICTHTHRGPSTQGWGQMQRLVTAHSCLEYCNYMYSECQQNGKTVLVRACGKLEPPWPLGTPPGHFFLLTSSHCHWPGHWWAPLAGVGAVTP